MATKRKRYIYENVIEVEEYHDGKYGAPGKKRDKKKKPTPDQMERVNQYNKAKRVRQMLREYFQENDWYFTLTYRKELRPSCMEECKEHFRKLIRKLRDNYRIRGYELLWICNIENTTTNNLHIHLVINALPNVNSEPYMKKFWKFGRPYPGVLYEEGAFRKLSEYLTKDEKTKKDWVMKGALDHKVTEASHSHSRNMPLKPPKVDILQRWPKEAKAKKGWYIDKETLYEGNNPVTGYKYRHYTMFPLGGMKDAGKHLHRCRKRKHQESQEIVRIRTGMRKRKSAGDKVRVRGSGGNLQRGKPKGNKRSHGKDDAPL